MLIPYKIELDEDLINTHRESHVEVERDSWHEYFILQAFLVSTRSLDSQTKFGTVIVDKTNRIISSGYNSFVRNIDDKALGNTRPIKYPFMIHSEHNAILSCSKNGISTDGCVCYVTGKPCKSCLQFMYQAGISKIYYTEINKPKMCEDELAQFDMIYNLMSHNLEINIVSSDNLNKKIEILKKAFTYDHQSV